MKKIIVWPVLVALTLSLAGCAIGGEDPLPGSSQLGAYSHQEQETEIIPARDHISLVFYEDMDIHPLTTTNRDNHELLKLVYSPLIRLNKALEVQYVLAESVEVQQTEVTLRLKKDLKFSDGSAVTASDVEESFRIIRNNPSSPYYARLQNLRRYEVEDKRTLKLTLHQADVDFINNLDIPIVKKGKDVGCGAYRFSAKGGERVLVPNQHYFAQPSIQTIYLKKPANEKERQNMFAVGLLDVYFGNAESEQVFAGGKSYRVQSVPGDNLLYLGVNCREGLLSNPKLRSLLNKLIGREKLVQSVLLGQAQAAIYPYQPAWYKAVQTVEGKGLSETEKKALAAELNLTVTEKELLDAEQKPLTFRLLVAKESAIHREAAQAVAESYGVAGVTIQIEAVARADYDARLIAGDFDLYLGEVKTGRTLNTALYAAGSAINYSGSTFPALEQAAADYQNGSKGLALYCAAFDKETPIIPLAYRGGALFAAADIGEFKSTGAWALYGDITKLITKETEIAK